MQVRRSIPSTVISYLSAKVYFVSSDENAAAEFVTDG